jgi:urea transporter
MASSKEEVNAWGSYNEVSRSARALPSSIRRQSTTSIRNQNESASWKGFGEHGSTSDLERSGGRRKSDPERGSERRSVFDFAMSDVGISQKMPKLDPEKGSDSHINQTEQTPVKEYNEPYELPRPSGVCLSEELKCAIREIFCVYFEGCHDAPEKEMKASMWARLQMLNGTMPWVTSYIERKIPFDPLQRSLLFIQRCFRGMSQVYFQNNPLSGMLIFAAMLIQSTRVAVYGLVGVVCGNASAYALGFNRDLLNSGLFGYNAFLVGLAIATFDNSSKHYGYSAGAFIWTIIMSTFSSVIFVSLGKLLVPYKSPPLTFPFNIATILFLIATSEMTRVNVGPVREPELPDYTDSGEDNGQLTAQMFFAGAVRGVGQVFLANNLVSGVLVLAGIAVCSRIGAVAALVGSALGGAFALATGVSSAGIKDGFYGFNSSLSLTSMFMFFVPSAGAGILGTLAALLTVVGQDALSGLLQPYGLPFTTLPFCFISLPFIILQGTTSIVISVPLATMTVPEDHLHRTNVLKDGYQFLRDAIHQEREKSKYGRKTSKALRRLSNNLSSEYSAETLWSKPLTSLRSVSERFCCGGTKKVDSHKEEAWVEHTAFDIFETLDQDNSGSIDLQQFKEALCASGLPEEEEEGLKFASIVFEMMATEQSDIDRQNFLSYALVSYTLLDIHQRISQFVDFVNSNNGECIGMCDLEMAQEYLGQEELTEQEKEKLTALSGYHGKEGTYFDVVELINFATVSYLKILVCEYRGISERTESTR